jgi:hypothetical protein
MAIKKKRPCSILDSMKYIQQLYRHFSNPKKLALLNGTLLSVIIACNLYFQSFCIPTPWALLLLVICFANSILFPLLEKSRLAPYSSFINGISFCVFAYCVVFLETWSLFALPAVIFGIGLVLLVPQFFILQLIWKNLISPAAVSTRYAFLTALLLCLGSVIYIDLEYRRALASMERFEQSRYTILEKTLLTEKILGMHFIYHTRIEMLIDGWRPPKHEPILVMGMWLNDRTDPLDVDLETRLGLYKKFFPDKPFKFDCSCGIQYGTDYHHDPLWQE